MKKGICIRLAGSEAEETGLSLASRLVEIGCNVEHINNATVDKLGPGAAFACRMLTRNGVIVLVTTNQFEPQCDCIGVEVDPNDTPDFAAEKIIDHLAEQQIISIEMGDYTPEEEEEVRKRLADLGYIE